MYAIETSGLCKRYGANRGIERVDLRVGRGMVYGFIGPNGAGKSTTIRTLLGLIAPTSGSARILGLDCVRDRVSIARQVGYIPSEPAYYPGMKTGELIRLAARLRGKSCDGEAARLCRRLQLDTDKKISQLSLGNRKKLSIVCAMQHSPELYIFDEPTSGLDPVMQNEFFLLAAEKCASGATVFLSSHNLSEIGRHCSEAAIIKDGCIIASGEVGSLTKTQTHRITLACEPAAHEVYALDGVKDLVEADGEASFLYGGDINTLLRALNKVKVNSISITEPDIEEIFMHYYTNGGAEA